jgi:hypothetical protein
MIYLVAKPISAQSNPTSFEEPQTTTTDDFGPLRPALVLTLPIATPSCPLAKKEAQSTSTYSRV